MANIFLSPIHDTALQPGMIEELGDGRLTSYRYAKLQPPVNGLALLDESAQGKIMLLGRAGWQAVAALGTQAPAIVGGGMIFDDVAVYRLRADQIFVSVPPGREIAACTALTAAETDERVTVTDITHGRAQLRLVGPASAELLSRLCGLDLSPGCITDHSAHQTSVAKTTQLVIRSDLPGGVLSYVLIGARSLGEYLWHSLLAAGGDLGIQPIGHAGMPPPAA